MKYKKINLFDVILGLIILTAKCNTYMERWMEMSDADIAREMNLVRSTIHEHRTRSLEILKKIMEGIADEKDV